MPRMAKHSKIDVLTPEEVYTCTENDVSITENENDKNNTYKVFK